MREFCEQNPVTRRNQAHSALALLNDFFVIDTMWLPESIYEKIPQFWFFAGLFFIFTGLYLGFAFESTILYLLLGVVCCLCGVGIFTLRQSYRHNSQPTDRATPAER